MLGDVVQAVRGLVPARAIPALARWRVEKLWADEGFRTQSEAHMRYLLEYTDRAGETAALARPYAEQSMIRSYLRWHPRLVTRQPVRDAEWLTTRRDPTRPAILSFMHHNQYYGMFASLKRLGAVLHILVLADVLTPQTPAGLRQHMRVFAMGGELIPTGGGLAELLGLMRPGLTLAMASDIAGHTEVDFLGRRVLGSSGAAHLALETDSPVIVVTSERGPDGASYLQVHPPLEPADFGAAQPLLAEMLRIHGDSVRAWPEVFDTPLSRFGRLED